MIEILVLCFIGLLGLLCIVLLPLMLLGALLKILFVIVTLPFRIIGAVFGAAAAVLGFLAKGFVALLSLVAGAGVLVLGLLIIPLLPFLIIGGMIWLLAKLFSPSAALA